MTQFEITGAARIGFIKATYPLVSLSVTPTRLEVNASIAGNLVFQPKDIVKIEPFKHSYFPGRGIQIVHKVGNYTKKVFFGAKEDPETLVQRIKQTGFLNNQDHVSLEEKKDIVSRQEQGSFPIKKQFALGFLLGWNALFVMHLFPFVKNALPGFSVVSSIGLSALILFLVSLISLYSPEFRRLYLKHGRTLKDIKKFLILTLIISGLMAANAVFLFFIL
ncbi:MAG: hypothetical protein AAF587_24480 [Bacteroidota bacterium]